MDLKSHQGVIIEHVLEKGSWEQARWLFKIFGGKTIAEWVRMHGFRLLSKRSCALWRLTLYVKDFIASEWVITAKAYEPW